MHKLDLTSSYNPDDTSSETLVDETGSFSQNQVSQTPSVHQETVSPKKVGSMKKNSKLVVVLAVIVLAAGISTGYGGYRLNAKSVTENPAPQEQVATGTVKAGDVFGVKDEQTFKDSAQGYLEEGGIGEEGSHKLLREGGETQTVVLTSSVTDLDKFVGMEIKVWGETFKAQKAGWLMDVGRVQVVNTQGTAPTEQNE